MNKIITVPVAQKVGTEDVELPKYETDGAAGVDIRAAEDVILQPGVTVLVKTGLYMAIPEGFELQIRSRSGLSAKKSVVVLNSPGTVDPDYRGEVQIILHNLGKEDLSIKRGERIAQGVFAPFYRVSWEPCNLEELPDTAR